MNVTIVYGFTHDYIVVESRTPETAQANFLIHETPPVYPSLEPTPQGCPWRATAATFEDARRLVEEFCLADARAARAAEER